MKSFLFSLLLFASFETFAVPPTDWMYLVAKDKFGVIEKTTTYDDLINLFGNEKLKDEIRSGPEGEGEIRCTVVYGGTELEMVVYWQESGWHKKISRVECTQPNSPYHTKDSLQIGSNLNALVKVNKAWISFYGFEWDYGGLVTDYHKGKLASAKVNFTLGWDSKKDTALLGDGEFNSRMPAVMKRARQIKVAKMSVSFDE